MQHFIVVASLVSELAGGGGQNDPLPLVLNVTKKHLSPLRVKYLKRLSTHKKLVHVGV